jgi:hypothetical protein
MEKAGQLGLVGGASAALGAIVRGLMKPSAPDEMVKAATSAAKMMFDSLEGRVAGLEEENKVCRGENRQLWSALYARDRVLRDHGIPIPMEALPDSLIVMQDGKTTVFKTQVDHGGD